MPGGVVGTGLGYRRNAMSGLARVSEQEQQRITTNKQLDEQSKQQAMNMGASTAGLIASLLLLA